MQPVETEYLQRIVDGLSYLWPEINLCFFIIVLILLSFWKRAGLSYYFVALASVLAHIVLILLQQSLRDVSFNIFISIAALLSLIMSKRNEKMEYYLLIITILLGANLLVMSSDFIILLLAVEMISISSYVLTAGSEPDKRRAEAAWKFFLFGSVSTAIMIFGMSYLFGATGSNELFTFNGPNAATPNPTLITVGGLMLLGGLFFKMTAAPFHLWAPDVYEVTPTPIVAYLSVAPKLAALAVVLNLVEHQSIHPNILAGFAILSILVGTLAALAQTNAKRMMAYSSVAHAGFLLAAVASVTLYEDHGIFAVTFYVVVFLVMNYIAFIVIQIRENTGGTTNFADFAGMGYRAAVPAVAITIAFASLIGLPPFAGFMAKFLVFTAVLDKFYTSHDIVFMVLFVTGLVATAASLFFYIKIPFYLFFRQSEQKDPIKISWFTNLLLVILVGVLLALFFVP